MINKLWEGLRGRKSYLVAIVSVLYAVVVVGWQGGDWVQAGQIILAALGLGALRNAI